MKKRVFVDERMQYTNPLSVSMHVSMYVRVCLDLAVSTRRREGAKGRGKKEL